MLEINGIEFKSYQTAISVFPYDHDTLDEYYQLLNDGKSASKALKNLLPNNKRLCDQLDAIAEWCDTEQSIILLDSECGCGETFSAYDRDECKTCNLDHYREFGENTSEGPNG